MNPVFRPQTLGEEIANAISHGIGFLLSVASLPILVARALHDDNMMHVLSVSVFSLTMMLLYLTSCLYHAMPAGKVKLWLNRFDHAAIYIFIAGSYTPFMLGVLRGGLGSTLLIIVWSVALFGVFAKMANKLMHPFWSTALYVALGWMAVVAVGPLVKLVPVTGLLWIVGGGLMYTLGAVVFHFDGRLRYAHFVWHLFVLAGSACHFFAVLEYSH